MGKQLTDNSQPLTKFEPSPRFVEIELPNDSSICFYKAGIKAGLEAMEHGKRLFVLAGDDSSVVDVENAINALTGFLNVVRKVEVDIVTEFQKYHTQTNSPENVDVDFAPQIEPKVSD